MQRITFLLQRVILLGPKKSGGFLSLFISKHLIQGAASALLGIFVPIFLYTVSGENFLYVGGVFALLALLYVVLLPPGVKLMSRYGYRTSLVLGGMCSALLYTVLFFMNEMNYQTLIWYFLAAALLFRIFHWVPYHVDFAMFTKSGERGRDVSLTFAVVAFLGVVGPLLAGYILSKSGYDVLFGVAIVLLLAATVSYSFVPNTHEVYEWSYWQTWKELFAKKRRRVMLGMFANGLEAVITIIAWPIFLYEVLAGNVFDIGLVSALVVGVTILVQLAIGHHLDKKSENKSRTLKVGSALYAFGWIVKIFVLSTVQIFFVGLYHNIVKIFTKTPFDTLLYDMTAEQGRYVDEFTVLREMATHLGRAVGLIIIVVITLYISIKWTFVVGALGALLLNMIYVGSQMQSTQDKSGVPRRKRKSAKQGK